MRSTGFLTVVAVFAMFVALAADEAAVTIRGADRPQAGVALTALTEAQDCTYEWTRGGVFGVFECTPVSTAAEYVPTEADYEHWLKVTVRSGDTEVGSAKIWFSRLPVAYLTTDDGKAITSKEEYVPAHLRIQGNAAFKDEKELYDGVTEVKGRGNSSWTLYPQKPYKLKLDEKANLLGLGEKKNKHWVLISNYSDDAMLRNWGASSLAKAVGVVGMDMTWVTVILNGSYNGVYMLCEHVRIAEDRVDIADWESDAEDLADDLYDAAKDAAGWVKDDKKALETQMSEDLSWITSGSVTYGGATYDLETYGLKKDWDLSGGYLYEMDSRWDEVSKFRTDQGVEVCISKPEFAKTCPEMLAAAAKIWQDFEDAYRTADGCLADGRHYSELADVDSMAAYWLVMEAFANTDAISRSRYSYIDRGGKLTFGPVWDFDVSSGVPFTIGGGPWALPRSWTLATMPDVTIARGDNFFSEWLDDPYFCLRAYETYWTKVRPWMKGFLAEGGLAEEKEAYLAEARKANDLRFLGPGDLLPDDKVLRKFLSVRLDWMDAQFADLETLMRSVRTPLSACPYKKDDQMLAIGLADAACTKTVCSTDFTVAEGADAVFTVQLGGAWLLRKSVERIEVSVNGKHFKKFAAGGRIVVEIPSDLLVKFAADRALVTFVARSAKGAVIARNYATVLVGDAPDRFAAGGEIRMLPSVPKGFTPQGWERFRRLVIAAGVGIDRIWEVADWVKAKALDEVRALAVKYLKASIDLGTEPIGDATKIEIFDFRVDPQTGLTFRIRLDNGDLSDASVIRATKERLVPYIVTRTNLLGEERPVDPDRVQVDSTGLVSVRSDPQMTGEFIRVRILQD